MSRFGHDRYEAANEYMDVVCKLWESLWHDNAVKRDKTTGVYTNPALVRPINHKGVHFKDIPGPVSRSGSCLIRLYFSFHATDILFLLSFAVHLASVAPAHARALPGRIVRRGHNLWRQGELASSLSLAFNQLTLLCIAARRSRLHCPAHSQGSRGQGGRAPQQGCPVWPRPAQPQGDPGPDYFPRRD